MAPSVRMIKKPPAPFNFSPLFSCINGHFDDVFGAETAAIQHILINSVSRSMLDLVYCTSNNLHKNTSIDLDLPIRLGSGIRIRPESDRRYRGQLISVDIS